MHRAYLPPAVPDPSASGSAAVSHFINVFGEKEKEVGAVCDLVPSFLVSLKIAPQQCEILEEGVICFLRFLNIKIGLVSRIFFFSVYSRFYSNRFIILIRFDKLHL